MEARGTPQQEAQIQQNLKTQMTGQLMAQMAAGNKPELAKAFVEFWGTITNVEYDAKNPFHKNEYATLEAVLRKVKPVARQFGLAFPQMLGRTVDGQMELITQVVHTSGQTWTFVSSFPLADAGSNKAGRLLPPGPQQGASSSSYLRRYTLMALCGICGTEDDDDGQAAQPDPEDDEPEEMSAEDKKTVADLVAGFKLKAKETPEDGLERMKKELEDLVRDTNDETIVAAYTAKRKELRPAKKKTN